MDITKELQECRNKHDAYFKGYNQALEQICILSFLLGEKTQKYVEELADILKEGISNV